MTKELFKYFESKGLEFCHEGKDPHLVNSYVHFEHCEQFAKQQNEDLVEELNLVIEQRELSLKTSKQLIESLKDEEAKSKLIASGYEDLESENKELIDWAKERLSENEKLAEIHKWDDDNYSAYKNKAESFKEILTKLK